MPSSLQLAALRALFAERLQESGLSLRALAAQIGVSAPTLSRLADARWPGDPALSTYLAVCDWLGCEPAAFLSSASVTTSKSIAAQLYVLLARDAALGPSELAHLLKTYELIKKGKGKTKCKSRKGKK